MRFLTLLFIFFCSLSWQAQALLIGTLAYNPPFEARADQQNDFVGFDIDIMTELCQRIQMECQFVPVNFEELFIQIIAYKIDLAIGGITITSARQEDFLFSLPYLLSSGQLITTANSPINTLADIQGKKIGVVRGSVAQTLLMQHFKESNSVLVPYSTLVEAFQALSTQKTDLVIADQATVNYWVTNNNGLYKLIGKPIYLGLSYGIMANKSATALIQQINTALLAMEKDGSYLKIYSRYFS